jgi:uncharacterized protein (UPF0335 family)
MSTFGGISGLQLKQFIERIEYLEEQKANISNDIREVFSEAKGFGFDIKIMRQVLRLRKMDQNTLKEQEELLGVYLQALSMVGYAGVPAQTPTAANDIDSMDAA